MFFFFFFFFFFGGGGADTEIMMGPNLCIHKNSESPPGITISPQV